MSKEAMKLALEALEQARGALAYVAVGNAETNPNLARSTCSHGIYAIDKVEPALREALAEQPQQDDAWKAEQKTLADEAVKCATEALANPNHPATMAAREYYGAAQQEPVVFYRCNGCGHAYEQVHPTSCDCMEAGGFDRVEYYTSPQASKPLTDEEIKDVAESCMWWVREQDILDDAIELARAIEAAHGIKENT